MPLSPGSKVGPYEILAPAGAGGMGEVYRARDTRLDRTVAIKILPSYLSERLDAKQRFEREARAISSLQHPNICTLFDIGSQNGTEYLVMEYLEGETLADRLARSPLPSEQLLKYGIEIAEGLEKAHRSGIIHRDLKPGNIMLTKSGAKLMDFGLAKAASVAPASGLTATVAAPEPKSPLTAAGTMVGTFQYMAPEQVEGKEADARSDIFALGAVLYEMATGKRAFAGKTQASIVASILASEPKPISSVQPMSPPALDRVVQGCLAKDPDERWQTAHDVKLQLLWIAQGGSQAGIPAPVSARRRMSQNVAWAVASAFFLAAVGFAIAWALRTPNHGRLVRASILAPEGTSFKPFEIAISPDGSKLAFAAIDTHGKSQLWVRPLSSSSAQPLAGTEGGTQPFWSPDSQTIGFFADGKLKRIEASGGGLQLLADAPLPRGGTWSRDGVILYAPSATGGLYRVQASGGNAVAETTLDIAKHEDSHRWPSFLADGRHYVFINRNGNIGTAASQVYGGSLYSKERISIVESEGRPSYALGYLLFVRGSNLMAQPFDESKLRLSGDPVPIVEQLGRDYIFESAYSVSQNGILVAHSGGVSTSELTWYDRAGKPGNVLGTDNYNVIRFSPDDRTLAASIYDNSGGEDIWLFDLARGVRTRFTFGSALSDDPVWSPDGKMIAFDSNRTGTYALYEKPANGTQKEQVIFSDPAIKFTTSWSRDGKYLLFDRIDPESKGITAIWVLPMFGDHKAYPLISTQFNNTYSEFSPDGHWVAYDSNESGKDEIYAVAFPNATARYQISTTGGSNVQWRGDGKELYYTDPDNKIMAVDIASHGNSLEVGTPHALWQPRLQPVVNPPYAAVAEGKRFLVNELPLQSTAHLTVVLNWNAEFKK
jgi:Tol biopolymer transport system component/tRNA A-37 threonylcarbamoyl transferase component Bud32